MKDDKRFYRQLKRTVKKAGGKRRRRFLKRELTERPEDAPFSAFDFGRYSSTAYNGIDRDATRKRNATEPDAEPDAPARKIS